VVAIPESSLGVAGIATEPVRQESGPESPPGEEDRLLRLEAIPWFPPGVAGIASPEGVGTVLSGVVDAGAESTAVSGVAGIVSPSMVWVALSGVEGIAVFGSAGIALSGVEGTSASVDVGIVSFRNEEVVLIKVIFLEYQWY
jgi:hypothetical protein